MEPLPIFKAWIYSREPIDTEEKAKTLVDYLLSNARFSPDRFGEAEPFRRITSEKEQKAASLIANRPGQEIDPERVFSMVMFERRKKPFCSYIITWSKLSHRAFEMSTYGIQEDFVENSHTLQDWMNFIFGFFKLQRAWYALFALDHETRQKNFLHWRTRHPKEKNPEQGVETLRGVGVELTEGIPGVYWGNYFGPFYVDWFGQNRLDSLPCIQKQWLDTGGFFFTTASSPSEWNTIEAIQLQKAIKNNLGEDAFFDIESVRYVVSELEPIPEYLEPEKLQSPRRIPDFPFEFNKIHHGPIEEQAEETIIYFTSKGFLYEGLQNEVMVFRDKRGGIMKVTLAHEEKIEYWPKMKDERTGT
jgi:hypothetical protein